MKLRITILFLAAFSTFGFAQRIATATPESDFKTIQGGFIESNFSFNSALSNEQVTNILKWAEGNGEDMMIQISSDKKQLTYRLSPSLNESALYAKLFYQLDISEIVISNTGQSENLSIEDFIDKFNM